MKRKLTVPSVSRIYTGSPHTSMPYATRFEAPGIPGLFFVRHLQRGGFLRKPVLMAEPAHESTLLLIDCTSSMLEFIAFACQSKIELAISGCQAGQ